VSEEDKNPLLEGIGDISNILEILTLLPSRAFILAVFTIILLVASPPLIEVFTDEATQVKVLLGIFCIFIVVSLLLWKMGEDYKDYNKMVKTLRDKPKKRIEEIAKSIRNEHEKISKLHQTLNEAKKKLLDFKKILKKQGGKDENIKQIDDLILKINEQLKVASILKKVTQASVSVPTDEDVESGVADDVDFLMNMMDEESSKND